MRKKNNNYARYFGVNRPIKPGIRVLVDFLNNYFGTTIKLRRLEELVDIEKVKDLENLVCKETDEKMKNMLYKSFAKWIESYGFFYSYINKNDKKYLLPLTKNMLYFDTLTRDRLKNVLFRLLYANYEEDKSEYKDQDKKKIEKFLFDCLDDNDIYTNIVKILDDVIGKKSSDTKNQEDNSDITFKYRKKLAYNLREDFDLLLTHQVFSKLDIYRKIHLFTLLLNFYVTLYVIYRAYDDDDVFILVKGSPDFTTENGGFHSATLGNFSNIRERIFKVSEKFYEDKIGYYSDNNKMLKIRRNSENKIEIMYKEKNIWPKLKEQLFDNKSQKNDDSIDSIIIEYLEVHEEFKSIRRKDIARALVESSKKRSSSVRMISTMFSGQGKEARMVYPITTARHKYYAMSSELTELLLKLFLGCEQKEYATLDMFLSWLEDRYGIYIAFSDRLMNYLSESSIKEPSNEEFSQNVKAFIATLESISAIEKLSDNSYIVYDSGSIGGVSWLI